MERTATDFGFPAFGSYPPGSVYEGSVRDNDWFLQHCPQADIATAADIRRRTGVDRRSFAADSETVTSIAVQSGEAFLRVLEDKGYSREQCRGVLLGTCAVEGGVLGLEPEDLADCNEDDPSALVQRTAGKVASLLHLDADRSQGQNYACSTTARLTEAGIADGADLRDDEYFLMIMAEKLGANLDLRDRNTGFLFGDHASVTALQRGQTRFRILHAFADTVPSDGLITFDRRTRFGPDGRQHGDSLCIRMDKGGRVLEEASDKMLDAVGHSLQALHMRPEEIGLIEPHQANARFARVLPLQWRRRKWPLPPPDVDIDLSAAGNNGSASWARRMAERQKEFSSGTVIMAPFVGAGPNFDPGSLSTGNIALEVGE